uniref:Uncharacterized protein n=1 Tax=Arion vulgaris TaxID=1028688 RepID=A0A0B6Z5B2_9EUPU
MPLVPNDQSSCLDLAQHLSLVPNDLSYRFNSQMPQLGCKLPNDLGLSSCRDHAQCLSLVPKDQSSFPP